MTMNIFRKIATMAGAGMIVLLIAPPPASAARISDFFKRKVITIYVGFDRASGHDRYSRVLARHLGRHIPGNPAVEVENSPGIGSLNLANLVYNSLPQDGTVIANVAPLMATEPLRGNKQARFNGSKFNWLGSMNNEVTVCAIWHTVPVIFWQDLVDRGAIMGGTGAASDSYISPLVLNNVLGARTALVTGYPNDTYINLAVERGEIDGRCGWSWSALKSNSAKWLKDRKIRILLQMSAARHPALPDIPLVLDFAKSKTDLQVLKLIYSSRLWGQPYMTGPKVPRARVAALRAAFNKTMTDERFLKDAGRHDLALAWADGRSVQKAIAELYRFPKEVIAAAAKASSDRSNIQISRAVIPLESAMGKITRLRDGGRALSWAGGGRKGEILVSNSRTKIVIDGEKSERKALKLGMACKFTYRATSAKKIDCQ